MNSGADRWPGESWYQAEAGGCNWPALDGDRRCRVAVVGGGLAGISTAVGLIERGMSDVYVLDAGEPGAGASGRNGGFVFAGYSLGNDALIDQVGEDKAARLHGYTRETVAVIRERIERYRIDCQVNDAGVVLADWFDEPETLQAMAERMRARLGFELAWIPAAEMDDWVGSSRYGGGLFEPGSFHFHPLRHIRGLSAVIEAGGGGVFGRSGVRSIRKARSGWRVDTGQGRLEAEQVVLATGGYDRRLAPTIQRALHPVATYIAVTEPLGERLGDHLPRPVAVYDTRFAFDYYRPLPDTRLLWGGRISMAGRSPAAIRRLMRRDLARVFPALGEVRLDYAWGGWMSYARHEMPLLGRTGDGLWYALAFGGHGMATTTLAGEVMAEALCGDGQRLAEFERWRPVWAGGILGRAVGQGIYWRAQLRDLWRDRTRRL
ncbi:MULTISPECIES: FAD-binding oxidoreductase [unclassified Wenzhouxiangella]|uniref:NAD(P)/FAD-dependent oxidoreductase n=1 Tax=unclassified Wenzhouxiangella TaxID=2613841 RepID=UPI0015F29E2D|nr:MULTISPECIES: FAD-binding oxidoreductase [unclassified Wenzhouxiangella]